MIIDVVSGVIVREFWCETGTTAPEKRVLLAQRPPSKDYPFAWETPGGKVEGHESHHQALARELDEELGLHVNAVSERALWKGEIERPGRDSVFLFFYRADVGNMLPTNREHQGLGWFTAKEMRGLDLAPGNKLALEKIAALLA